MKTAATALLLLLFASPARADDPELFNPGKPVVWAESKMDVRFAKSRLGQALQKPPSDPACGRLVGTFLAAFAETAPYLHKKDQNFFLDPVLVALFQEHIGSDKFPAVAYLQMMVRRTMIDRKAPEAWLATAKALKKKFKTPIDLDRLAFAVDAPHLIDGFQFTLPMLMHRYQQEILLAPSIGIASAHEGFETRYLDRDVAWGGLMLVDVRRVEPPPRKPVKGKKQPTPAPASDDEEGSETTYWATLMHPTRGPPRNLLFDTPPPKPVVVRVKLHPEQYLNVKRTVRSGRYLATGRLWSMKPGDNQPDSPAIADLELRDGLLFEERDWNAISAMPGIATAADAQMCDLAVNDLSEAGLRDNVNLIGRDPFAK